MAPSLLSNLPLCPPPTPAAPPLLPGSWSSSLDGGGRRARRLPAGGLALLWAAAALALGCATPANRSVAPELTASHGAPASSETPAPGTTSSMEAALSPPNAANPTSATPKGGAASIGENATGGRNNLAGGTATGSAAAGQGGAEEGEAGAYHFVGRYEPRGADRWAFEWSGSGLVAAFEGSSVSASLEDGGSNQFTVVLDGKVLEPLKLQSGAQEYSLADNLEAGEHRIELYRRTEASFGPTVFHGLSFGDGGALLEPPASERRIEIIGDSITCGYGNEGDSPSCPFSADTENHYLSYGAIAARALDAELSTVAWSGKGVVYNYDTDTTDPLPSLYERILPSSSEALWSFPTPVDAVVINLGTNDFSTDDDPEQTLFQERYVALLQTVRGHYPDALILCTVGPLLGGVDRDSARSGISNAAQTFQQAGDPRTVVWVMDIPNSKPGCDYHPGLGTHEVMAAALEAELRRELDW